MKLILPASLIGIGALLFTRASRASEGRKNQEQELMTVQRNSTIQAVDWDRVRHFRPAEFQGLADYLDPATVYALDEFRHRLGSRVMISPAPGAIVRADGNANSQHYVGSLDNPTRKGTAIDVMPLDATLQEAFDAARQVDTIGGIGVYPDWKPMPGLHLDTRPRNGGHLATWMGLRLADGRQHYTGLDWGRIA